MTASDSLNVTDDRNGPPDAGGRSHAPPSLAVTHSKAAALNGSKWRIAAAGGIAGLLAFGASSAVPPTYAATADVVVSSNNLADANSVTAANDVAGQLAQLAMTPDVLAVARGRARVEEDTPIGSTSAATPANTNIVRVTVTSRDPDAAGDLARAVVAELSDRVRSQSREQQRRESLSQRELEATLSEAEGAVVEAEERLVAAGDDPLRVQLAADALRDARQEVVSLELKRIDLLRLAGVEQGSTLTAQASTTARPASLLAPRPGLYSLVTALLVAAISAWWVAWSGRPLLAPRPALLQRLWLRRLWLRRPWLRRPWLRLPVRAKAWKPTE